MTVEYRRILLEGSVTEVRREGESLIAGDGRTVSIDEAIHLPPVTPTKIIAVHLNYLSRVDEFQTKLPSAPTYFMKPTSALNSHRGQVVRPLGCKWLNYEGEIAIVVGKVARNVAIEEVGSYIRGYSIANDYGLHDFRDTDAGSMLRVKGSDSLCPIGPGIVEGFDPFNVTIRTIVNNKVVQEASTSEMMWNMHYLFADLCRTITLYPGDIILSGTPANSRPVIPGDVVEVEVDGLGKLTNHIVEGPTPINDQFGAQPTESEEVISTALGGEWEFRGVRPPIRG